jgi:hypothetical protein
MIKIKADAIDEAGSALGDAEETEFTFLLMPVLSYSVLSEQASKEGCAVGEVLQKAIMQYLQAANGIGQQEVERSEPIPEPDMVLRRNKRRP